MINIKNIAFGIAIVILTMFVGIYGISTLYGESPRYEDFCPNVYNQETCEAQEGEWINNTQIINEPNGIKRVPVEGGYCQYDYNRCQNEYEDAQRDYYKKVFLTALPLGIIVIFLGATIFGLESVGAGLMLGGVGLILYGSGSYWRFTDDWLKFLLSLAGLIILIWAAYWFNKKEKNFWRRFFTKR